MFLIKQGVLLRHIWCYVVVSPVAKYFGTRLQIRIWIKVNIINSTQNEGLSPSCTDLSFDRFGSILWHYIWFLSALSHFLFGFPAFKPEHHWRDLISRNAHLVHQNCYRISFTFEVLQCNFLHLQPSPHFGQTLKCIISRDNLTNEVNKEIWRMRLFIGFKIKS
jgi:hypothetical protein